MSEPGQPPRASLQVVRSLEVSLPLLHFHRPFFIMVDSAILALATPESDELFDNLRQRVRVAAHRTGAWRASQRPHTHLDLLNFLAREQLHALMNESQCSTAYRDRALLGKIERHNR